MISVRDNIFQPVAKPDHLKGLHYIADGMVGEICREVEIGAGTSLQIEMGVKWALTFIDSGGRIRELVTSRWRLETGGTTWELWEGDNLRTSSKVRHHSLMYTHLRALSGLVVADYWLDYEAFTLTLYLGRYWRLVLHPPSEKAGQNPLLPQQNGADQPYWALATPYGMALAVGPGRAWSYQAMDD